MRIANLHLFLCKFLFAAPSLLTLSLGCALGLPAAAQGSEASGSLSALDAHAPSAPLTHTPLTASGSIVHSPGDWAAANAAVGEFPRGHADIVQWERRAAPGNAADDKPAHGHAPVMPQQHHHSHGGAKP